MPRPLALAIQDYVVDWSHHPWPVAWEPVFGRQAPLVLEIGFGNGSFLEEQARAHPERDHLGIELSWTAARHLFRRLQRHALSNVRVLLGEAEPIVRDVLASETLSHVFVNHPCPWPKTRHHARRLLERGFLALLARRMRPGAHLTVVTDHADYAAWLVEELGAQTALASRHASVEITTIPGRTPTKYERKAMAQGVPIHYFEWQRVAPGEAGASAQPHSREILMPTLTLKGAVDPRELFRDFPPLRFRERHQELEVVVKVDAVYHRVDRPVWLLETYVREDRLQQTFGIDVVVREQGILVQPSDIGRPYPTHGVKRAVWCVARWLQTRHPGLAIDQESLGLGEPAEPWPPT